jgi:hypothetical protein
MKLKIICLLLLSILYCSKSMQSGFRSRAWHGSNSLKNKRLFLGRDALATLALEV